MYHEDPAAHRYAELHLKFLEDNNPAVLRDLEQSGDLSSYLSSVGEQASLMFGHVMAQYRHSKEVQDLPHLQQVQALQSRRHEAEEIVLHDVIFQPLRNQQSD